MHDLFRRLMVVLVIAVVLGGCSSTGTTPAQPSDKVSEWTVPVEGDYYVIQVKELQLPDKHLFPIGDQFRLITVVRTSDGRSAGLVYPYDRPRTVHGGEIIQPDDFVIGVPRERMTDPITVYFLATVRVGASPATDLTIELLLDLLGGAIGSAAATSANLPASLVAFVVGKGGGALYEWATSQHPVGEAWALLERKDNWGAGRAVEIQKPNGFRMVYEIHTSQRQPSVFVSEASDITSRAMETAPHPSPTPRRSPPTPTPRPQPTPTSKRPMSTPTPRSQPAPTTERIAVTCQIAPHPEFHSLWEKAGGANRIGCPLGEAYQKRVAYQPFEHGFMLWKAGPYGDPGGMIYVAHDSGAWQEYHDTWATGQPEQAGLSPPSGLREPRFGFSKLWREQLGGPDSGIGWALTDERGSDFGLVQDIPINGTIFRFPGEITVIFPDGLRWVR